MSQQGPSTNRPVLTSSRAIPAHDRISILERMAAHRAAPVVDGSQCTVSRNGDNFCLTIECIGRAKSVRYEVIVGADGQYRSAVEILETSAQASSRQINNARISGLVYPFFAQAGSLDLSRQPHSPRFKWCKSAGEWIDLGSPMIALQPVVAADVQTPKFGLCYPAIERPGVFVGLRSETPQTQRMHAIQELLVVADSALKGPNSSKVERASAVVMSVDELKRIGGELDLAVNFEGGTLSVSSATNPSTSCEAHVAAIIEAFWRSHLPPALTAQPKGTPLGKAMVQEQHQGVQVSSFLEIVQALSVPKLRSQSSTPPLDSAQAQVVADLVLKRAVELQGLIPTRSGLSHDNWGPRNEIVRALTHDVRNAGIAELNLDGFDVAFLLEYGFDLVGEDLKHGLMPSLDLKCGIHRKLDGDAMDAGRYFRHFKVLPVGGEHGGYYLQLSRSGDVEQSDTNEISAAIHTALGFSLAREGVKCVFPIEAQRDSVQGDQFWINIKKLGEELSVADPELFVSVVTHEDANGMEARKHGGRVSIGGHSFLVIPQIVECYSKLGAHELKAGFVGHVESSIYPKDQGGDAEPQLEISIYGADRNLLVTTGEHRALTALIAKVKKVAATLHQ